jgi:hypothetical protein
MAAGRDERLATLAVHTPCAGTPSRTPQRIFPRLGRHKVASCVLPSTSTSTRQPGPFSNHTSTSTARGTTTATLSWWVAGSGATIRYAAVVGPRPNRSRRGAPYGCTPVLVRNPTTLPGGTSTPAGGSCATTTALRPWGSRSWATPCRPPVRITRSAWARVRPRASGTPYPRVFPGAVRRAGAVVAPAAAVVAGRWVLGAEGSSRPATASTASPTSSIAAVATRPDVTRMLPPACAGNAATNRTDRRRRRPEGSPPTREPATRATATEAWRVVVVDRDGHARTRVARPPGRDRDAARRLGAAA